jgi:hypothetical protein
MENMTTMNKTEISVQHLICVQWTFLLLFLYPYFCNTARKWLNNEKPNRDVVFVIQQSFNKQLCWWPLISATLKCVRCTTISFYVFFPSALQTPVRFTCKLVYSIHHINLRNTHDRRSVATNTVGRWNFPKQTRYSPFQYERYQRVIAHVLTSP